MTYIEMFNGLMEGKKAKLSYWGKEKYLYIIKEWNTEFLNKNYVPFIAIIDGEKIGPAVLHNCDLFKTDWEFVD